MAQNNARRDASAYVSGSHTNSYTTMSPSMKFIVLSVFVHCLHSVIRAFCISIGYDWFPARKPRSWAFQAISILMTLAILMVARHFWQQWEDQKAKAEDRLDPADGVTVHSVRVSDKPRSGTTNRIIAHNRSSTRLHLLTVLNLPGAIMTALSGPWKALEKGPEPGKRRLKWTCACGKVLYDDFEELKPGATLELQRKLNLSQKARTQAVNIKDTSKTIVRYITNLLSPSNGNQQHNGQYQLPRFGSSSGVSNMNASSNNTNLPSTQAIIDLNMCVAQNRVLTKFHPLDLTSVKSNRALFAEMRSVREKLHHKIHNAFSLRALRTIRFVRFVLHKRHTVDIKDHSGALSLPPPDKLGVYKYRYDPAPPDYLPPIGENLLMHLYSHPECADEECADLLPLFPKKVLERLDVCPNRGMSEGWGIHFVEDWNWERIWVIGFALFGMGGVLFLILWWALEHDVQGASSMATYITSFMALALGVAQLKIQPTT